MDFCRNYSSRRDGIMREIPRAIIVFALAAVFVALSPIVHPQLPPTNSPKRGAIDRSKVMDLTYSFDESTIYWPTAKSFDWQKESWGTSPGGYWYASARYAASEHGGTHIDSPIHFGKDQATTVQIPRSEEHTSERQSRLHLVCHLLLEKKKKKSRTIFKH